MFQRLADGVQSLGRWDPGESANIAAALFVDLRRKQPNMAATDVGNIVLGDPSAQTPSVFATPRHGYHHHSPDPDATIFSAPISSAQQPSAITLAPFGREITIDSQGFLTDPGIVHTPIDRITHDRMPQVNAIVLHRTDSSTADSTLSTWRNRDAGTGAHFLIDRDGTIHQTVSVDRQAWHVGAIRSRGEVEGTIPLEDQQELSNTRGGQAEWRGPIVRAVSRIESTRPYPERYPTNKDSIGIEVVARYQPATQTWESPTPEQAAAIKRLMGSLQRNFALSDRDVYEHDVISRKTPGEGSGLYSPTTSPDGDPAARAPGGVPVTDLGR